MIIQDKNMQTQYQNNSGYRLVNEHQNNQKKSETKCFKCLKMFILFLTSSLITFLFTLEYTKPQDYKVELQKDKSLQFEGFKVLEHERHYEEVNKNSEKIFKHLQTHFQKITKYEHIDIVKNIKELPFCLLVPDQKNLEDVLTSISKQTHQNYKTLLLTNQQELPNSKIPIQEVFWHQNMNYYHLKGILEKQCRPTDIIFVIKAPLINSQALYEMNFHFQLKKNWVLYTQIPSLHKYQILAFYMKVYDKIGTNDFDGSNTIYLKDTFFPFDTVTFGIFQMAAYHISKVSWTAFFKTQLQNNNLLCAFAGNNVNYLYERRTKYQKIFSLSQTYKINEELVLQKLDEVRTGKVLRQPNDNFMRMTKILKAIENIQMKNLPENHTLFDRQRYFFEKDYQLSKYTEEPPMCVVVLSNNNIENQRYKKVMDTIKMQEYSNYHIVFIDDVSTDNTFNATKQYVKEIGIPDQKIDFVKNTERRYASYNLKMAAFEYCKPKQIFVIVDGDDELIGKLPFKLISTHYLKNEGHNWIVYTNYLNSYYELGASYVIPDSYKKTTKFYRKWPKHMMGPIRTFYTDLFRLIKDEDHRDNDGKYLDTMYDDAMQEPMLQMAGYHVQYIPQLCYYYNKLYGNNDNSTPEKKQHKRQVYDMILKRKTYDRLQTLFND